MHRMAQLRRRDRRSMPNSLRKPLIFRHLPVEFDRMVRHSPIGY